MIIQNINGHTLEMYDSIEDLPIVNFQKYNRYLLLDSGLGNDIEDVDSHLEKIAGYINIDKKLALQELQNMRQALYFVNENLSPKMLAFVTLIHKMDGNVLTDLSDDNIKGISVKLNTIKKHKLFELLLTFKKKTKYRT